MGEIWIDTFCDAFCDLSLSDAEHLLTADVLSDGRSRLTVLHTYSGPGTAAVLTRALRVFDGTKMETEIIVKSESTALVDVGPGLLALAAGASVYFFKNLKPYYKYEMRPALRADVPTSREAEIWSSLKQGSLDAAAAVGRLQELGTAEQLGSEISKAVLQQTETCRQSTLSHLPLFDDRAQNFLQSDAVNCMTVIKKEPPSENQLILGTELGFLIWLEKTGTREVRRAQLSGPVAYLTAFSPQTIISCTRNGHVQSLTGIASNVQNFTQLETPCCGMVGVGNDIIFACLPHRLHVFALSGERSYTLSLDGPVRSFVPMHIASVHCLLVALHSGEMRLYQGQRCISEVRMPGPVAGMTFGRYGTEDNVLITVLKSGALDIKVLRRQFRVESCPVPAPVFEDPLSGVGEEAGEGIGHDLHIAFQRELQSLRLETLRCYAKLRRDADGSFAENRELRLQLQADIRGLGPKFQILLGVTNTREGDPIRGLAICLSADAALYRLSRKYIRLPWLLRGCVYTFAVDVASTVEGQSAAGEIRAVVVQDGVGRPVLQAAIPMPVCSFGDGDLP